MSSTVALREQAIDVHGREQADPASTERRNLLATEKGTAGFIRTSRRGDSEPQPLGDFFHREPALIRGRGVHEATASRAGNRSSMAQPKCSENFRAFSTVMVWYRPRAVSLT